MESLDAAVFDVGEDEPGGAVEQGEHPAAGDNPAGPSKRADVLANRYVNSSPRGAKDFQIANLLISI